MADDAIAILGDQDLASIEVPCDGRFGIIGEAEQRQEVPPVTLERGDRWRGLRRERALHEPPKAFRRPALELEQGRVGIAV